MRSGDTALTELPTLILLYPTELAPGIPPLPISHTITKICSHCLLHSSQDLGKYFQYLQTHKSWCCHSPLQDSVECTIHNLSERQELITSPSLLLEQLHSFSVYLYQMFQERHRGSVPDEVHSTMIKSPRLILDVLELLLNLLHPNIKEFVTSAALHLFTRD